MTVTNKKTNLDELSRIKKNINASYLYFKPNYDRFHKFRKFVFSTSLSMEQKNVLMGLKKPVIEFNILEAYISRLLGEFAKHEPSIEITPADGAPVDIETIKLVEGHIRHIIYEANKNSCSYEVYKDLLSGGFSTVKLWTDYATPMSMHQIIKLGRVFDPTLCGFDPMARYSHKGDGRYCYEIFPQSKEDFERENPDINLKNLSFSRNLQGFNWSYMNGKEEIVIRGEYFEKKKKKAKIVKISNGRVMTEKEYGKFQEYWKKEQIMAQCPVVVGKSRITELETICRTRLIESEILEYKETDYTYLPLIFVDGNSILIRDAQDNAVQQMTRPYVYHAEGIQNLKNFAGQTLANELENMIQHKFIMAKESLPQEEDYLKFLDNVQQAGVVIYQAYNENMPDQQLPPPREVVRTPIPQEVMGAYSATDSTSQIILGTFDSALGINDNQLSGVAIQTGASLSNAAAMPFVTGYLQAWTHISCMITDLMPLYIKTPRTIPTVGINGKREYKKVNQMNGKGPQLDYEQSALNVYVEAGVNFQIQKNQALEQIIAMMKASEEFAAFINGPGLPVLIKNLTCYGADELQEMIPKWLQQKQQMAQQQQQQQMQMMQQDPRFIDAKTKAQKEQSDSQLAQAKFAQEQKQEAFENQITVAKVHLDKQKVDQDGKLGEAKIQQDARESQVQVEKAHAEVEHAEIQAMGELVDRKHSMSLDKQKLEHDMRHDEHSSIRESVALMHEMKQAEKAEKEDKGEKNE